MVFLKMWKQTWRKRRRRSMWTRRWVFNDIPRFYNFSLSQIEMLCICTSSICHTMLDRYIWHSGFSIVIVLSTSKRNIYDPSACNKKHPYNICLSNNNCKGADLHKENWMHYHNTIKQNEKYNYLHVLLNIYPYIGSICKRIHPRVVLYGLKSKNQGCGFDFFFLAFKIYLIRQFSKTNF